MGNELRGIAIRLLAVLACVVAAVWLALWYFIPTPPSTITFAVGVGGTAFEQIAQHYRERLASHHVKLILRKTGGMLDNIKLVNTPGSGIDAAFLFGGLAAGEQVPRAVSLGRISYSPMGVFYRGPQTIERLTQLKGKRIALGPARALLVGKVLGAYGINAHNTTLAPIIGSAAIKALKDGEVDAAFLPVTLDSPTTESLLQDPAIKLLDFRQAETLTRLFPYLSRLVLPQGIVDLEKNIPATDVNLIATTNGVIVREDLHPELIYLLAQTMQEEHGGAGIFQRAGEFPTQTDPEFPMAEEARDYYKNGPSFLHRYLTFRMVSYAKRAAAIMVAAFAIVLPLVAYAPRLYLWFVQANGGKLYRRLRTVEAALSSELTAAQIEALQADLESINRAAHVLPLRHSDLYFSLLMHIEMTRTRLAARSTELQRLNTMA